MKKLRSALKYVSLAVSSRAGGVGSTDSAAELGQLSRDLNFTAPETRVCLQFQVVDDTVPEDDEQYRSVVHVYKYHGFLY